MPVRELRILMQQALPGSMAVAAASIASLSAARGAYALVLHVPTSVRFTRVRMPAADMSGWFVYAGSAYGGGGMGARLGRHFRRDKAVRWHIDELTNAADDIVAFAIPEGRECDIVDTLLSTGKFETAFPGFGSSDCRRCTAHLLRPYRS
jgi:Uri superfamily endonuclease